MFTKEFAQEIVKNAPIVLVIGGIFLFVIGAGGGLPSLSIQVVDLAWRIASAALGAILVVAGSFAWWKERKSADRPTTADSSGKSLEHKLYLGRKDIHWQLFNDKVSYRFWACGTSLVAVVERGLIQEYFKKGIKAITLFLNVFVQIGLISIQNGPKSAHIAAKIGKQVRDSPQM